MNVFLFVTANEHEREAFEAKFIRQESKYILGKTYYLGQFGLYPAAYIRLVMKPNRLSLRKAQGN